ncbi:MAG TPA: type II secretion system protein GspG [Blastocatellia bacterium]|nr:type II secretion system protein GspG [Blastocatellia bacterium]
MTAAPRVILAIITLLALLTVVVLARELGAREAREKVAAALGMDKPDRVHIKSITPGSGNQAIVEAQFDAAFRFTTDPQGNWQAAEVRTGDRNWESIELIQTAVRKEKALRTTADLRSIVTALEAFRRERGYYVVADNNAALIDNLAPRYLGAVLRLDAWSHEFQYKGSESAYRLTSLGADGKAGSGDEIVFENGQLVKGASQ